MSSKGRGAPVAESEFYPSPRWAVVRILEALPYVTKCNSLWLEPCCGDGAIVKVIKELSPDSIVDAGDIRTEGLWPGACRGMGFEQWEGYGRDVVITNPPFSLAPELIRHFLPRCDWLILLLRASFRLGEWRHNMPDEYKLPQRPEFLASEKCLGHGDDRKNAVEPCGWSRKVSLSIEPRRACPACAGFVQRSTSDSSEYSWFVWTPERNRSAGLTRVLPDTSLEERKER